jgi:DNA-binding NtrC family response regulator
MMMRILIADDEAPARYGLIKGIGTGYEIIEAADGDDALRAIQDHHPDLVFLDLHMPHKDGLTLLRELAGAAPLPEVVVISASDRIETAVEAMRLGASDYITKPYELARVRSIVRRAAERRELLSQVDHLRQRLDHGQALGRLIGISRPMLQLFSLLQKGAASSVDILIRGETGTGKELVAREIHDRSCRRGGAFVAVNTAAIHESLIESELFGHVKGAFTGASNDRRGFFEEASGGTLFLDEIGDMPLSAQTKMLRVLQERVVQPVGSREERPIDVRIISATHQDLEQAINEKRFRADLFFRIKQLELTIPPLRQRREDILPLAQHFLHRLATRANNVERTLDPSAIDHLLSYSWPGNVRELENALAAAHAMAEGPTIHLIDLPLSGTSVALSETSFQQYAGLPLTEAKNKLVDDFERFAIESALATSGGNVSAAARLLGIHRQNLQQKMSQLGIGRSAPQS